MKRDEIKFNQTRWTKQSSCPSSKMKKENRNHVPFYDFQCEEDMSISEEQHDIYSPCDPGGEMPRPVISPPSKIIDKDTDERMLAEYRKRMSSSRKESNSMSEGSGKEDDFMGESRDRTPIESNKERKKNHPFIPEILTLLKQDPSPYWNSMQDPQEIVDHDLEAYPILTDIVSSMGESSDNRHGFKSHYQEQENIISNEESSIFEEVEKSGGKAKNESISDNLFTEVCSMLDESSSWSEKIEWSYEEESSLVEPLACTIEDHEESTCEQVQGCMESSSSEPFCEEDEESSSQAWNMTVKVPVLLSTEKVEINVMETLNIPDDLCEIIDIQLSIHSQKETVVLPSSYVFLSGVLMVEVIYDDGETMQQIKRQVPWQEAVEVNWEKGPQIPYADRKAYTFDGDETGDVHHEFSQTFVDPVEVEVESVRFISHSDASSTDGKLYIQGSAQLVYNFLQKQYVAFGS
ncbi:hypothetical protein VKA52_16000 [Halobacillus sp. HZG1]|uniref:hypothetical protein n=1 Tax=Halobacillus sp. HZG1 TaxID=3111769 RepID=UPI002DBD8770|nr:hypothetical protein [Halobacillus sp. HZG1]MEC3885238.1 hypothetical protein [Halobacillus sp. HZG1]